MKSEIQLTSLSKSYIIGRIQKISDHLTQILESDSNSGSTANDLFVSTSLYYDSERVVFNDNIEILYNDFNTVVVDSPLRSIIISNLIVKTLETKLERFSSIRKTDLLILSDVYALHRKYNHFNSR